VPPVSDEWDTTRIVVDGVTVRYVERGTVRDDPTVRIRAPKRPRKRPGDF